MKNFKELFEYNSEYEYLIDLFNNIYFSDEYKVIKKRVKISYKKDLCKFLYWYDVYKLTEQNAPLLKDIEKRGNLYHIDHIIPIAFGYKYGIPSDIIGDINNLQIISLKDNFSKGNLITKEVKKMFSYFNINEANLVPIIHPLIKYKSINHNTEFNNIEEKEKEIKSTINDKYRLSSFPIGGNKLGN